MEKSGLSTGLPEPQRSPRRLLKPRPAVWFLLPLVATAYFLTSFVRPSRAPFFLDPLRNTNTDIATKSRCAQPSPLFPSKDATLDDLYTSLSSPTFRNATIARLSGAVQVKSESFDDLGAIGTDPRWDVMYDFAAYLAKTFPLAHERLQLEKVNTHGLLYTWAGSDASLKPTLLMAHQDTVPVPPETIPAWTYPPWSGAYDGTHVWGRGASDCKNQLIAVLETVELLLGVGWTPRRTILLSFGFDEECSGRQGAGHLAPFIRERYGDDGLAVIVDEGAGFEEAWGTLFAKPATAEKGYTDVFVTVRMPGGHSSIPADHTGIGVLSELITRIEAVQYRTRLDPKNPYYAQLQCGAAHSEKFPSKLKKLLSRRLAEEESGARVCKGRPDYLALEAAKQGPEIKYLMQTSQAVDVIHGGVKTNALPERVQATVNHRVNVGETPQDVWTHITSIAKDVAKKYKLSVHAFDGIEAPSSIMLEASDTTLEVAPVSPADGGDESSPFSVLAGTVRAVYGKEVVVTSGIMTGNTDTRYFWDLTKHIFRFGPGFDPEDNEGLGGIHTVDERISVVNHINTVKWFMLFVRNMDEIDI